MNRAEKVKELLQKTYGKQADDSDLSRMDERILSDASTSMKQALAAKQRIYTLSKWRKIMRTKMVKLATAAAVFIAAFLLITLDRSASTAWSVQQTMAAIKDLSKCEVALISDGGLVPKGNPDGLATRSNLRWGAYDVDALFSAYEVRHAGYFNDHVLQQPDRLVPVDVLLELEKEGKVKLHRTFFSTSGCTTVSQRCGEMGEEIGAKIKEEGAATAAILTST